MMASSSTSTSPTTPSLANFPNSAIIPFAIVGFVVFVLAHIPCFILIWWKCRARARQRIEKGDFESEAVSPSRNGKIDQNSHGTEFHLHSSNNAYAEPGIPKEQAYTGYGSYCFLGKEEAESGEVIPPEQLDHDYEEPYFEPATEEEAILMQLKKLSIPVLEEENGLKTLEFLGSGAFGKVFKGIWKHVQSDSEEETEKEEVVAIKTTEAETSEDDRVKFLQEAAIMGQFSHPSIIRLLGIVSIDNRHKIILELMTKGDLRKHLSQIKPSSGENVPAELAPTLLSYSRQIANGMMYLAVKSFIHRDLAARNILVSEDCVCKIADFGLSRDLQDKNFYKSSGGKIPVKWTAPEALHYHKYSTASDVWSYGCVLYEIWSLGYKPFHFDQNPQVMKKISTGFRLPPPPGCPRAIYDIMIQCWNPEADLRPAFVDIMIPLQKPDFQVLKWSEQDTKSSSTTSRTLATPLEAGATLYQDLQRTYLTDNSKTKDSDESAKQQHTRDADKDAVKVEEAVEKSPDAVINDDDDGYENNDSKTSEAGQRTDGVDDTYDTPMSDNDSGGSPAPEKQAVGDKSNYFFVTEENEPESDGYI